MTITAMYIKVFHLLYVIHDYHSYVYQSITSVMLYMTITAMHIKVLYLLYVIHDHHSYVY